MVIIREKGGIRVTEIEFRPIKRIIILEDISYDSLDDFFAVITTGVSPSTPIVVLWANGVVFTYSAMPLSEAIVKERTEGIVYWNFVQYAKMDEYVEEYRSGLHTVRVLKVKAPALLDVAKALQEKLTSKI